MCGVARTRVETSAAEVQPKRKLQNEGKGLQNLNTSTGIRYIDEDIFWNSELLSIYLQVLRCYGDRQSPQ